MKITRGQRSASLTAIGRASVGVNVRFLMPAVYRLLYILALLTGCAASATAFVRPEPPLDGHDRVYLYRPIRNIQVMDYPSIQLDDKTIGPLKNGGFLTFLVAKGTHKLTLVGNPINWPYQTQSISLEALGNRTYYMRFDVGIAGLSLTYAAVSVEPEQALKEMNGLRASDE